MRFDELQLCLRALSEWIESLPLYEGGRQPAARIRVEAVTVRKVERTRWWHVMLTLVSRLGDLVARGEKIVVRFRTTDAIGDDEVPVHPTELTPAELPPIRVRRPIHRRDRHGHFASFSYEPDNIDRDEKQIAFFLSDRVFQMVKRSGDDVSLDSFSVVRR